MTKKLLVFVVLVLNIYFVMLFTTRSVAQTGVRRDDITVDANGKPVGFAALRVCREPTTATLPCAPLANIYSDQNLAVPTANPTQADALGNSFFFAAPGFYHLEFSAAGLTPRVLGYVLLPTVVPNPAPATSIPVPGSPNNSIQYNNSGVFAGNSGFLFDSTKPSATITGAGNTTTSFPFYNIINNSGTSWKADYGFGGVGANQGWDISSDYGATGVLNFVIVSRGAPGHSTPRFFTDVNGTIIGPGMSADTVPAVGAPLDVRAGAASVAILADKSINTVTGYRVNSLAPTGQYLRCNGTDCVPNLILSGDVPQINLATSGNGGVVNLLPNSNLLHSTFTINATSPVRINGGASATPALGDTLTFSLTGTSSGALLFAATPTTGGPTTASLTPAVLAELTSGSITTGGKVLLSFMAEVNETNVNDSVTFAFFRDGSQVGPAFFAVSPIGSQNVSASMSFADSTTAGAHTYDVRWNVNAANTATSPSINRSFSVVGLN